MSELKQQALFDKNPTDEELAVIKHRELREEEYGTCWNTKELQRDFTVTSFLAPYVFATRKSDNVKGMLRFDHEPRLYYNFTPNPK